jgi:hypothetical protein
LINSSDRCWSQAVFGHGNFLPKQTAIAIVRSKWSLQVKKIAV